MISFLQSFRLHLTLILISGSLLLGSIYFFLPPGSGGTRDLKKEPRPSATFQEPEETPKEILPELIHLTPEAPPTPTPCSPRQLIRSETQACKSRDLTPGERVKQVRYRMGAKGFVEVTDSTLFEPTTFTLASFNVLGAGHTAKGGRIPRWPDSGWRTPRAVKFLQDAGVTLAGLQEFQSPQYHELKRLLPQWGVYPGLEVRNPAVHNSIVWDEAVWERVEAHVISIPYFGGKGFPMPYVLLRHKATQQELWIGNFHNPASGCYGCGGNNVKHRDRAVVLEGELAAKLAKTGRPVLITGDMNDRENFFCSFTKHAPFMKSSQGLYRDERGCHVPPGAKVFIDWITGSSSVTFSNHVMDWRPKDQRVSDHPLVHAQASLPSRVDEKICRTKAVGERKLTFCPRDVVSSVTPG